MMPPLLCLSPTLLDQSFPRDVAEVDLIGIALGEVQALIEENKAHLIVTTVLRDFIEVFEWDHPELNQIFPKLKNIYDLLNQFFLQPHERLITIIVPDNIEFVPHPIPAETTMGGLVEDWAFEVGKIYAIHNECIRGDEIFIGVACESAFSGDEIGEYENPNGFPCFPIIGPEQLDLLTDAYEYKIPEEIRRKPVSFSNAYNRCNLLGSCMIEKPHGGSHYKVKFLGAPRPWPLDRNIDPIPERFLRELVSIINHKYSLEEIKFILITGEPPPPPQLRIRYYCV